MIAIPFVLALMASPPDMIGDPVPRPRVSRSDMIGDPFDRQVLPASLRAETPEPEPTPSPPAEPAPAPKADMPPVCACVLSSGECRCAAEAKQCEPPVAPKPAPTFTPGVTYPPKFEPSPVYEWRPFTANPAYEVLGREDAQGVFRYCDQRLKAGYAAPAPTYAAPTYAAPAYQGYSAGSSCAANGSCAQPQSQGFNLFRGFRGR